jgi:hypothetical protein
MSQFYLTLPSDSSSKYYPENTTACFKTKLKARIELDGEYEVGLAQLIYPHSWFNFNNSNGDFYVTFIRDADDLETVTNFSSGTFINENTMARVLSEWIELPFIELIWNQWTRKMKLAISADYGVFYFSPALADLLGFDSVRGYGIGDFVADRTFDMNRNLRMLYLYSDIVSYSFVGDTQAPLLRVCDTQGVYGQMVQTTFTHPYYVPLAQSSFESIEINIYNELGKSIPFEFGKAVVTLHFRRKNKLLL